jgi:hypothetical protein
MLLSTELAAEPAQLFLLSGRERPQEFRNPRGMLDKKPANQLLPFGAENDDENPAVLRRFLAVSQPVFFKVTDDHSQIAAGGQDFLRNVGKRHGAEVVKRLEDSELG